MRGFVPKWVATRSIGAASCVLLLMGATAHAQLRIVTYNTLAGGPHAGLDVVLQAIGEESRNGIAKPIDVLLLQAQDGPTGDTQQIVAMLNGIYGAGVYARGSAVGASDDPDQRQTIVYNTQSVSLLDELAFGTLSESGRARQTLRYQLRPVGYDDSASFYVYNSHFKTGSGTDAGGTTSNADRRYAEALSTRSNADALGDGTHILYAGDHSFYDYDADEPAWGMLAGAGAGQASDPMNRVGPWQSNAVYADVHTRSPCLSGCVGANGGLDNRFDFQLVTGEFFDGEGLDYIDGSYHAFGNNGSTFQANINGPGNTVLLNGVTSFAKSAVLNALWQASDHLPVVADYQLPAVLEASIGNYPTTLTVGQAFNLALMVRNAADVTVPIGADELDYSVTTGFQDPLDGSYFNQMDMAQGEGNVHFVGFDTSTPGMKSGTILVQSSSQGVANPEVQFNIAFQVVEPGGLIGDYNQNNVVDAADYTVWRDRLGAMIALPNEDPAVSPGRVTIDDYNVWKSRFGQTLSGGGAASVAVVPEPAGGMLLAVAACLAVGRPVRLKGWTPRI